MSRRLSKAAFVLALVTGVTAFAVAPVSAVVSVTVTPALVTLEGDSGGDGTISISITNDGDEAFTIDTGTVVFQDMVGVRSAVAWMSVSPRHMRLKPGMSESATILITIPDGLASGGRYAGITFSTSRGPMEGNVASIGGRVTVPILLAVSGDGPLTREPTVEAFAGFIEADGRLGFRARIVNDGNVHLRVAGSVQVGAPGAVPVATLEIQDRIILPDATRLLTTLGTLPMLSQGRFHATASLAPPSDADGTEYAQIVTDVEFDALPQLALTSAGVCENLDRGPTLHGILDNPGEIGLLPILRFEIFDDASVLVGSATPTEQPIAWPGETLTVSAESGQRLVSGSYTLQTTGTFGLESRLELTTPFSIGGDPSTAAPLCVAPVLDEPFVQEGT